MAAYRPNLPPDRVHANLKRSLHELRHAERNAVLWFGEVMSRKLYRGVGCSSIQQYAATHLAFSKSKTSQFIRLCNALNTLPRLKQSISSGVVSWTKAREVAKVATPETESAWVAEARQSSSRELEEKVYRAQGRARADRGKDKNQVSLEEVGKPPVGMRIPERLGSLQGGSSGDGPAQGSKEVLRRDPAAVCEVPVNLQIRLNPEQYARYEALVEKLRKQGRKGSRAELLLAGLEAMVFAQAQVEAGSGAKGEVGRVPESNGNGALGGETMGVPGGDARRAVGNDRVSNKVLAGRSVPPEKFTRGNFSSPYQVVVQLCEDCGRGRVTTSQGLRPLSASSMKTILCDSRVTKSGKRNQATIRQSVRRQVLSRDRFRCRAPGCDRTSFLNVHHVVPREAGGPNKPENLVTLCSGCHRALHELADRTGPAGLGFAVGRDPAAVRQE